MEEKWLKARKSGAPLSQDPWRDDFAKDRDRIVHCREFRKLQTKSQMFGTVWMPHFFSRCTHSLQVSQIGRTIARFLKDLRSPEGYGEIEFKERLSFELNDDLIEAVCLAHDIGHPPFGHAGEHVLQQRMSKYGGFEGNAQTFRVLTEFSRRCHGSRGLDLTRATLLGILKYPWSFSDVSNKTNPKFSLYDQERALYEEWLFEGCTDISILQFRTKDWPKTLACGVMDWADTIAYAIHDLEDAYRAGFLRSDFLFGEEFEDQMEVYFVEKIKPNNKTETSFKEFLIWCREKLGRPEPGPSYTVPWMEVSARLCEEFIRNLSLAKSEFHDPFDLKITMGNLQEDNLSFLRGIVKRFVVFDERVKQASYKSHVILRCLFKAFLESSKMERFNDRNILHQRAIKEISENGDSDKVRGRARNVCDLIYSMSEGQAIDTYNRLFTASSSNPYFPII